MGILAPISVIDSANINKLGPLLATEWIGTTLSLWRNPLMGEQRAVIMWRRKDTHRDNPVTMEERKSLMGEQATAAI
jgi:hypothetical protein